MNDQEILSGQMYSVNKKNRELETRIAAIEDNIEDSNLFVDDELRDALDEFFNSLATLIDDLRQNL